MLPFILFSNIECLMLVFKYLVSSYKIQYILGLIATKTSVWLSYDYKYNDIFWLTLINCFVFLFMGGNGKEICFMICLFSANFEAVFSWNKPCLTNYRSVLVGCIHSP